MPKSLKSALDFLSDLRENNNREWFAENRKRYDKGLAAVEAFLSDLFKRFTPIEDLGATKPKDAIYRIYRDVRFSPDKTPYKTHIGTLIANGGRKSEGAWYYLHLEPDDNSFLVAGLHEPEPAQLKAVREAIAADPARLKALLNAPAVRAATDGLSGQALTRPPKGYSADHPAIELLKQKEFLVSRRLSDKEVLSEKFADQVIEICAALKPVADYFGEIEAKRRGD